ncbi:hypothetical protein QWA68_016731 [Fusarium oxysporum]|nr:hypothetical protein QWA68_016731 [Fusarium oxysporum]
MEVAEVESDKGGGGLTIGGIIGAVLGSITSTSIHVEDVDPVQSFDKDAALRGTSLPSTHAVRSIAPIVLTRTFNIIRIAYIPGVIKRANPMSPNHIVTSVPMIPMHTCKSCKRETGNLGK